MAVYIRVCLRHAPGHQEVLGAMVQALEWQREMEGTTADGFRHLNAGRVYLQQKHERLANFNICKWLKSQFMLSYYFYTNGRLRSNCAVQS